MHYLLLLFIVVPVIELALLIEVGSAIGTMNTLALIIVTGVAGAALARRQGLGIMRQIQDQLAQGQLPGGALIDGAMVLVAGAMLMTPGIMTDAAGFLCLIPATRNVFKGYLLRRFERGIQQGTIRVHTHMDVRSPRRDDAYDIHAEEVPRSAIESDEDDSANP